MNKEQQAQALALLLACQEQIRQGNDQSNPMNLLVALSRFIREVQV